METDYDSPWKEALERYLEPFMALFFPAAHRGIDWVQGYEFLDKELQQVVRDAELGRRLADKLVKVFRRDGIETWVLIHIEVQGQKDLDFSKRMYVYHYRLFDRYNRTIVSLAVLGDEAKRWRPEGFGYELWGCEVAFRFPVVKLSDYHHCWEELEASPNPFAIVVMAHLKGQETRRDPKGRLWWKLKLVKALYERGYTREDILELFRFIDWLMALPDELKIEFSQALFAYEQEKHMPYVTSIERMGIEKGRQEGRQEGEAAVLLCLLERKFGPVDEAVRQRVVQADDTTLLRWCERVLTAQTLEEVWLES